MAGGSLRQPVRSGPEWKFMAASFEGEADGKANDDGAVAANGVFSEGLQLVFNQKVCGTDENRKFHCVFCGFTGQRGNIFA